MSTSTTTAPIPTKPTRAETSALRVESFRELIAGAEQFYARETEAFLKAVNKGGILTGVEWRTEAVAKAHGNLASFSMARNVFDHGDHDDAARFANLAEWAEGEVLKLIDRHAWDQYSTNPIANVIESAKLAGTASALHEIREFATEVLADLPPA